jgi:3-oxoadipate enol-lactonase
MPFARIEDSRLYYETQGSATLPCLVFSNSLGTDLHMWDRQAALLARDFHVLRYDTRGHGRSAPGQAPLDMERLGRDVLGLLDHLGIGRAHFCGISMGGLTGQWLGIHAPGRVGRLALANTAARIGSLEGWSSRAALVRRAGMDGVADGAAGRWFTEEFIGREPGVVARMIGRLRAQSPTGYAACCDALARCDLRDSVEAIASPTLLIAGAHDPVTTVADAQWLAARLAHAEVAVLPASHLSNIEVDQQFTAALLRFLRA